MKQGRRCEGARVVVAAVDVCMAVFSTQDGPFGEDCQAVERGGAITAHNGIGQYPVIESQVDAIMAAVESHGLYVDISCDQFSTADSDIDSGIQDFLGTGG